MQVVVPERANPAPLSRVNVTPLDSVKPPPATAVVPAMVFADFHSVDALTVTVKPLA
jgi:hypothetical protein